MFYNILGHFDKLCFKLRFYPSYTPAIICNYSELCEFINFCKLAIFFFFFSHFSQPLPAQPRTLHTRSTKALPPFSLIPANSPKNVPAHPFHSPIAYATFFPPFHALCFHPTFTHLCLSAQNCCNPFFKLNSARPQPT